MSEVNTPKATFSTLYPSLSIWAESWGWIEIGEDEGSDSLLRILDEGGLVWESDDDDGLTSSFEKAEKYINDHIADRE